MAEFISLADAANLTQSDLFAGIYQALTKTDQVLAWADKYSTDRPSITINREVSLGTVGTNVGCDDAISSSAADISSASFSLETIVQQFEVCKTAQDLYSTYTDALAANIQLAAKSMGQTLGDMILDGGSTFKGLVGQISNSFAIAGSSLDLADLDKMIDEVRVKSNKMAFIGSPAAIRCAVRELREASGGMQYMTLAGTDMTVPNYLGVPMLKSDYATAGEIYLVNGSFTEEGWGLVIGRNTAAQNVGGLFGFEKVGVNTTKLRDIYRLWMHGTSILKSQQAAARLTGVN